MSDARIELEAMFHCPSCQGTPYKLFRRSTSEHPEIFTHIVWPTEPGVPPPTSPTLRCPADHSVLVRGAA